MSDSTGSLASFVVGLGGGSAGCNASIVSFYEAIGGIIGLSGRGRGGIGNITYTVVVTLFSAVIGSGISGSYTGSATATIYR